MVTAMDLIGSDQGLQEHWIKRFVAILIDAIIIYVVASIIFFFLPISFFWGWGFGWSLLAGCLLFLYSAIMEMNTGATLGKKVVNLQVISLHDNLKSGDIMLRNVSKIHGLFLFLDWLVGFVTEGDPKQKYLDRNAGTTVILTDTLTQEEQHTYQSQQSSYAPPPPEQYVSHETPVYQYPPQTQTEQPDSQAQDQEDAPDVQPQEVAQGEGPCSDCGGRLVLTGSGRMQCIRCGRIF